MASGKKASEGIALLSMYGDEEDDEMEDLEELKEKEQEEDENPINDAAAEEDDTVSNSVVASDSGTENTPWPQEERGGLNDNSTPNKTFYSGGTSSATTTSQQPPLFSPQQQQQQQQPQNVGLDLNSVQSQKNMFNIVDYGHDEVAMSPEAEEGEIMETGQVKYGEEHQMVNGEFRDITSPGIVQLLTPITQATPPQLLKPIDQPGSDAVNYVANEAEVTETEGTVMISAEEPKDPLYKFLSPPAKDKCSDELQEKIIRFLALKKTTGRSFNSEVRNRKQYRNPDFLLHAVTYQDIDQIGSCFSKDVFNPHGYDKRDFYDGIEADMRCEMERKEQEKKKNQKADFISGGSQPGIVVPTPKINRLIPGLATVPGGVLNAVQASVDSVARDGRQNKKSKWDKVDSDQWNSLISGGHDSLSTVDAHSALLSASKAVSGYSAFAQQRRKEAEDR
ncbi:transcriptional regulator family [Olea europaea subsp. europaea]|uniref:Transcriptional regulator family n=1 Tax=Olea europaea subsp. europaea TaxID=158383 RepID=A0A8S0STE2_OLEEU|nr:transcriptional regulator family [Olea europaea subsp. europaea]